MRNCPWRDELQLMVLGKLDRCRAEAIAQHLDTWESGNCRSSRSSKNST